MKLERQMEIFIREARLFLFSKPKGWYDVVDKFLGISPFLAILGLFIVIARLR